MRCGDGGDGRDQDLRGGADDSVVAVVLGDPEAVVTQRLAVLGERNGVADRVAVWAADDGDRLVEYGEAQRRLLLRCRPGISRAAKYPGPRASLDDGCRSWVPDIRKREFRDDSHLPALGVFAAERRIAVQHLLDALRVDFDL